MVTKHPSLSAFLFGPILEIYITFLKYYRIILFHNLNTLIHNIFKTLNTYYTVEAYYIYL